MKAHRRALWAVVSGALVLSVGGLAGTSALADGEQSPPGAQSIDDACEGVPSDYAPFGDVDGNQFEDAILCLAYAKVTRGGPGGAPANSYVPQVEVDRDAMASFVVRLMDTADDLDRGDRIRALPAYDGTPSFSDIDGNTHVATISRLADAGIVKGGTGGAPADQYLPGGEVTRGQMASFLDRTLDYVLDEPIATADDYYTDDRGDVHEQSINNITSVGIAAGRSPGSYAPRDLVDRDNMAAFLARTLGELEERGATEPLPAPAADEDPAPDEAPAPDQAPTADELDVVEQEYRAGRAVDNPDTTDSDDRTYQATGLAPDVEYRITLVEAGTLSRNTAGQTVFAEDGDTGLAAVGIRTADITQVNGAPAENNTGDGTERTPIDSSNGGSAVGESGRTGVMTFVVDLDADDEAVVPVFYRNGGPSNAATDGGSSPRLELNDDGTAAEAVATGGVFGENVSVSPDDTTPGRLAVPNPDNGFPTDDRTYQVTGLVPGDEYRITVVEQSTTELREDGQTVFTRDGHTNLAAVGTRRSADITSVDGEEPVNNTGRGTATTPNDPADSGTAVFVAGGDGTATFVLDLDANSESVLPVLYRNGGPGNSLVDGGHSPRLELGRDGVPIEVYDVGGVFRSE